MGKKRAGKDRAYLTNTEWREEHGGCAWLRWGGGFWLPFGGGGVGAPLPAAGLLYRVEHWEPVSE